MFLKVESKSQWRSLSDKALFKTFFHSSDWEDFLEKEFFWMEFERYVWKDEFLLSIARCRLFGKEKLASHPFCEYGGPMPLREGADYYEFEKDFAKEFGCSARMRFHPYVKTGFRGNLATFWIENYSKKSADDLWKGLRKTLRQEIKGGDGQGMYVEDCRSKEDLAQFYEIYLGAVRRHKNIPLLFSFFEFFQAHEFAKIFLAKRFGKVVGGSVFLFYQPFIHYFINASDQKFRSMRIGHKILWHVMKKYAGHEYDYFDLGGTRRGSVLEVFKRGWGAKEYPIFGIGNNSDKGGVSSLRNILGLVPSALMKRAAPFALWLKV